MQPLCDATFKTIKDALKIRPNCPFCKKALVPKLEASYLENRETFIVDEFGETHIKYRYSDNLILNNLVTVTLDVENNHFDFNISSPSDTITDTLNGPNIYFFKDCEPCKYTITWFPFLFMADSNYFKLLRLWAETWEDGNMLVRNDFTGNQLNIYETHSSEHLFSKSNILELTEQNAHTISQKIKTFIVFS